MRAGSDTPQMLALDVDFTVYEPPELVNCRRAMSDRYQRAITQRP